MKETSIIIVHLFSNKRLKMLLKSIDSLANQTYNNFELILIIDNIDMLPAIIINKLKAFDVTTNLSAIRRGAAWCRKIGVEMSCGKYIAFLDDDAIAHPEWLENLLYKIKKENLIGIGGKTLSSNIKTKNQLFYDISNSQRLPLTDEKNIIFNISTVNACFKRDALIKTHVINDNYIHFAKKKLFFWFEDYDITFRLGETFGYDKLGIAEKAIVYHNHRSGYIESFNQFKGYGKGAAFWLWCYNKSPIQLKGNQQLPNNLTSISSHLKQIIKSLPYFIGYYRKARIKKIGILDSLIYSLHSYGLRIAFHFGAYKGAKLLLKHKWAKKISKT